MTAAQNLLAIEDAPLSPQEQAELLDLEHTIEHGLDSFLAVGDALAAIRDGRLYRATHRNFATYLADRWPEIGSRRSADRLISAAEVDRDLQRIGLRVANEAQARELSPLAPDERRAVMLQAIEASPDGKPTAAAIKRAAVAVKPAAPQPIDSETLDGETLARLSQFGLLLIGAPRHEGGVLLYTFHDQASNESIELEPDDARSMLAVREQRRARRRYLHTWVQDHKHAFRAVGWAVEQDGAEIIITRHTGTKFKTASLRNAEAHLSERERAVATRYTAQRARAEGSLVVLAVLADVLATDVQAELVAIARTANARAFPALARIGKLLEPV